MINIDHMRFTYRLEAATWQLIDSQCRESQEICGEHDEVVQENESGEDALGNHKSNHGCNATNQGDGKSSNETCKNKHVHSWESIGIEIVASSGADPATDSTSDQK